MVDPDRVRRLLDALSGYRDRLGPLSEMPLDRYVAEQALAGRYLVQVSAQACIALANHLIASEGWRVPEDFRDAFVVLEENGAIDPALAERLRALAGLRNRLVHVYADVDDTIIHAALPEGLDDLDAFAVAMARLVEAGGDRPKG